MKKVVAKTGDVRDVNNTCNVLHVPRSAQFDTSAVLSVLLNQLATGADFSSSNDPFGQMTGVTWLEFNGSSDVVACTWAKDIDGVVGTMSVMLKPRTRYLETVLPGDLLVVFMSDVGGYVPENRFDSTLVSIVVVDRCALATRVVNHATVEDVVVTARDLAVVLSESSTVFDQAFAQIEQAMFTGDYIGQLFGDKKQVALSPMQNVLVLLRLLYDSDFTGSKLADLQWKLRASGDEASVTQLVSLLDVTTYVQNPMPFYAIAEPPGIAQAGNVWSLLESYANSVVNEFFVDVRDANSQERDFRTAQSNFVKEFGAVTPADQDLQNAAVVQILNSGLFQQNVVNDDNGEPTAGVQDGTQVVALVHRMRPYDEATFSQLPYTEVDSTEVESSEVARSSHDVFNWFRIRFPNLDVKSQEVITGIRVVPQSIAKYGFRRMEAETRYMFLSSDAATTFRSGQGKPDFSEVFNSYIHLLSSWFAKGEFWLAGPMTMRFKPSIRVGTRLRLRRGESLFDFYVQGVQHTFNKDPGASRTQLTLVRGRDVSAAVPVVHTMKVNLQGLQPDEDV